MRIIAYTYCADVHCPECAKEDYPADVTLMHATSRQLYDTGPADARGVGIYAVDREGNPVRPVFSTDEHDFDHCGDCFEDLL